MSSDNKDASPTITTASALVTGAATSGAATKGSLAVIYKEHEHIAEAFRKTTGLVADWAGGRVSKDGGSIISSWAIKGLEDPTQATLVVHEKYRNLTYPYGDSPPQPSLDFDSEHQHWASGQKEASSSGIYNNVVKAIVDDFTKSERYKKRWKLKSWEVPDSRATNASRSKQTSCGYLPSWDIAPGRPSEYQYYAIIISDPSEFDRKYEFDELIEEGHQGVPEGGQAEAV